MSWVVSGSVLLTAGAGAARAGTLFDYRGHRLRAVTGSGVPGVQRLRFTLSGRKPDKGTCRTDLTVVSVSDGGVSLQELLRYGFRMAADSHVQVCRDKAGDLLSESLYLHLELHRGGMLQAAYSWTSHDPRMGGPADSVTEFVNVEYHVSAAAKAGHLAAIRAAS